MTVLAPIPTHRTPLWHRRFAHGMMAVALLAAILAMAGVGVLGIVSAQNQLTEVRTAKARAVAHAVQRDIGRALGYGIPLDRIEGMSAYLEGIAGRNPDLHVLTVTTADGRTLHAAGPGRAAGEDGLRAVRLPLRVGETVAGHLLVAVAPAQIRAQIAGELGGVALGATAVLLLLAEVAAAAAQVTFHAPLGRLARAMGTAAAGSFGTLIGRRPRDQIGRALLAFNAAIFELHDRRQRFASHAEEVRGAVFDPAIAAKVESTRDRTLRALGDSTAMVPRQRVEPHPADVRAYAALLSASAVLAVSLGIVPSAAGPWLEAGAALAATAVGALGSQAVAERWTRGAAVGAALVLGGAVLAPAWPALVLCAGAGGFGAALAWRYARAAGDTGGVVARGLLIGGASAMLWSVAGGWAGGTALAAGPALLAALAALPIVRRS